MSRFSLRRAAVDDADAITALIDAAFGGAAESGLVAALRVSGDVVLELVAEARGDVVGHILFSRCWVSVGSRSAPALALAPMAVAPDDQRRGAGTAMVEHAMTSLRADGETLVFVVGHPGYYPRFGFSAELAACFDSPYANAGRANMAMSLGADAPDHGRLDYAAPFAALD